MKLNKKQIKDISTLISNYVASKDYCFGDINFNTRIIALKVLFDDEVKLNNIRVPHDDAYNTPR